MLTAFAVSILLAAQLGVAQDSIVVSATATTSGLIPSSTAIGNPEPCAQVAASIASYQSANPSATINPNLPYDLIHECSLSVPVYEDDAVPLLEGLMAMLEFQSDLAYKANPPPGYLLAGVDMMGELQTLKSDVESGAISGEVEFETRLLTVFGQAHDGHLTFRPDGLYAFGSSRQYGTLVSVSIDGIALPKIYFYSDMSAWLSGTGSEPSAITRINNMDAAEFVLQQQQNGTYGSFQDPDALYNVFFFAMNNGNVGTVNWAGYFSGRAFEDIGATTSLTFENGTSVESDNFAYIRGNFSGVVDGESFYQKFINATVKEEAISSSLASVSSMSATSTAATTDTPSATSSAISQITGYPLPIVISEDGTASGYFLNAPGFEDTAVLALRSMSEEAPLSFQETVTQFLDSCRSAGKRRLVVDLSGNGGGTIALGYDTFKQLFPTLDPYGAGNYRAHEGFRLLGESITPTAAENLAKDPDNYTNFETSPFAAETYLDVNDQSFTSFGKYYGPVTNAYGKYTTPSRLNLSSPAYNEAFGSIIVSGEANSTNHATQPFESENIIILSDGRCSSTCTIFAHFMKYQGKVKSIAIGGRPINGPMQSIGGIKGSEVFTLRQLASIIARVYRTASDSVIDTFNGTSIETIYNKAQYVILRTISAGATDSEISFNLRNNLVEGDSTYTPLQYIYEAADCRMFYTPPHILNVTSIWLDVAANAFGLNGTSVYGKCTAGSTNQPSSLSGNSTLYGNGEITNATTSTGPDIQNQRASSSQNAGSRICSSMFAGVVALIVAAAL